MSFSKKQEAPQPGDSKMVELTGAQLDMVAGGYYDPGPGFGVATAYNFAGATNAAHALIATTNAPAQAAASSSNPSSVAQGRVTAGAGNPSQFVGHV